MCYISKWDLHSCDLISRSVSINDSINVEEFLGNLTKSTVSTPAIACCYMFYNCSADRLFNLISITSHTIDWKKTRKMWYWCIVVNGHVFSWFLNPLLQMDWQEKGNYSPEQSVVWGRNSPLPSGHRGPHGVPQQTLTDTFKRISKPGFEFSSNTERARSERRD